MNAIRRLFTPSPAAVQAADPARQRLRDALGAQALAKANLQDALDAVGRVRELMRSALDADAAALDAERVAVAATQAWASAGANVDHPPGDTAALAKATQARRRAADCRLIAEGAQRGLPDAQQAAVDARTALDNAADEIKDAIGAVLLSEVESQFQVLEQAHSRYVEALAAIKALHAIVRRAGPAHPFYDYRSDPAALAITERLSRCEIPLMSDGDLRQRSGAWIEFARRLRSDPDAAHEN